MEPAVNGGTAVTRKTLVTVSGQCLLLKKALLIVGLKHVHRYVFKNWERQLAKLTGENC